jgi:hypothetical protein
MAQTAVGGKFAPTLPWPRSRFSARGPGWPAALEGRRNGTVETVLPRSQPSRLPAARSSPGTARQNGTSCEDWTFLCASGMKWDKMGHFSKGPSPISRRSATKRFGDGRSCVCSSEVAHLLVLASSNSPNFGALPSPANRATESPRGVPKSIATSHLPASEICGCAGRLFRLSRLCVSEIPVTWIDEGSAHTESDVPLLTIYGCSPKIVMRSSGISRSTRRKSIAALGEKNRKILQILIFVAPVFGAIRVG